MGGRHSPSIAFTGGLRGPSPAGEPALSLNVEIRCGRALAEREHNVKAIQLFGAGDVRFGEVPDPRLEHADEAIVRVTAAGICGSDLHLYHGRIPVDPGFVVGHEFAGVVEEAGSDVSRFKPGDRVVGAFHTACGTCWFCRRRLYHHCEAMRLFGFGTAFGNLRGAQAERVAVPNADLALLPIPDGIDDMRALFVGDILTTAHQAVRNAAFNPGDTVAIIGCGPVGLLAQRCALLQGAGAVYALDRDAARLKIAAAHGAIPVNIDEQDPLAILLGATGSRGPDAVVECVGAEAALTAAIQLVRRAGVVSVAGVFTENIPLFPYGLLWIKDARLAGGLCNVLAHWSDALALVEHGRIDPSTVVSHELSLAEAPEAYRLFDRREALKVVLRP